MRALKISKNLASILQLKGTTSTTVHMVFHGALNLMDSDGHLIGLLSAQKDLAPMSIIVNVSSFDDFSIQPGDDVLFSGETIRFPTADLTIKLAGSEVVDLKMEKKLCSDLYCLNDKLDQIRESILEKGSMEGIAGLVGSFEFSEMGVTIGHQRQGLNDYSRFIQQRLIDFLNLLMKKDLKAAEIMLPKIIGFGPGLTPSTDDFLAGIIAVGQCVSEHCSENWSAHFENRTTLVSVNMIRHIERGCISQSHKMLVEGLFDDQRGDVCQESNEVLRTGFSSGSDFLLGVYCIAKLHYHEMQAQKE